MSKSEFNELVDKTLLRIEEAVDDCGADIDYENVAGILTLEFVNGSKVVINRQAATAQLWVAAKSGGYHFNYDTGSQHWLLDSSGEELFDLLGRVCSQQADTPVVLT